MALTKTQISELYVSIFNRASEKSGSQNWLNSGYNNDAKARASAMLATDAAQEYFGTSLLTDAAFVEHIYATTLNKGGATVDAAGKAGWVEFLATGASRGEMVVKMIEAIKEYQVGGAKYATADQTTKDAAQQFANRVEVSNYMAETVENAPADYKTSTAFATSGTTGLVVTSDTATIASAEAAIDAINPAKVGETFTLTTGAETITGTDKNDLFIGVVSSLNSEKTLDSADVIDGGAGTDTLQLEMKGNLAAITGSVSNVENVELTNATTIARTFDAKNFSGVEKYTLDSAKGISLSNLAATGIEVAYEGTQGDTKIGFASKATNATTDAMSISLKDVGTAKVLKADGVTEQTAAVMPKIAMDGIEDVTLKSTGTENFVDLSAMDAKTLTISGDAALDIKDIKAGLTTLDASTMTGALTANLTKANGTELKTVSTGSGDDALTIDAADLVANATISGGAGNDTLTLTNTVAGSTLQLAMSGIETVAMSNTNKTIFSAKNVADLTTLQINAAATAATEVVNLGSADITLSQVGVINSAAAVALDNSGNVTVDLTASAAGAIKGAADKGAVAYAGAEAQANDITLSNAGSVTVNVGDYVKYTGSTKGIVAAKATDVTLNVNSSKNAATTPTQQSQFNDILNVAKATSVTINSQGDTTLVGGAGKSDLNAAETVSIVAGGAVDLNAVTLNAAANVTLSGEEKTSTVTLGTVGTTKTDYDVTVNATGLKAGLTVGDIKSVQGATVNLTGTTGNVVLGKIDAANVTLNAANLAGILSNTIGDKTTATGPIGAINSTDAAQNTGAAVIDVSSSAKAMELGAIGTTHAFKTVSVNASSEADAVKVGNITAKDSVSVDFSNNLKASTVGVVDAKAVTIDASSALGAVTIGTDAAGATTDIKVTDSLVYTAGIIAANATNGVDVEIAADTTNGTSTTVTLNGNIGDDKFIITGGNNGTQNASITVSGNLDIGNNVLTVSSGTTTGKTTLDLSGVTAAGTTTVTINGGANDDTIKGSAVADIIYGGAGEDTLTGGAGKDTFVFLTGDSTGATTMDKITDFTIADDKLQLVNGTRVAADVTGTVVAAADLADAATAITATITNGIVKLSGADAAAINTIAEWIKVVGPTGLGVTNGIVGFELDGNTYIYEATRGVMNNIIELTGVTGIDALGATAGTNTIVISGPTPVIVTDVEGAEALADAGETNFAIEDSLTNVIGDADSGALADAASKNNGITNANTITVTSGIAAGSEVVEFDAANPATTINFVDNEVTLTQAEAVSIALNFTAEDAITVTDVTVNAGDFAEAATIDKLDSNDTIAFDSAAATLNAANYKDVFETKNILATATDTIKVTGIATTASLKATDAIDTFDVSGLASTHTASIANIGAGDKIDTGLASLIKADSNTANDSTISYAITANASDTTITYELTDNGTATTSATVVLTGVVLDADNFSISNGVITVDSIA